MLNDISEGFGYHREVAAHGVGSVDVDSEVGEAGDAVAEKLLHALEEPAADLAVEGELERLQLRTILQQLQRL